MQVKVIQKIVTISITLNDEEIDQLKEILKAASRNIYGVVDTQSAIFADHLVADIHREVQLASTK